MSRLHKPNGRTKLRIDIIRELRLRDLDWKEIAHRLGYTDDRAVHRMLRGARVKVG